MYSFIVFKAIHGSMSCLVQTPVAIPNIHPGIEREGRIGIVQAIREQLGAAELVPDVIILQRDHSSAVELTPGLLPARCPIALLARSEVGDADQLLRRP